MSIRLNEVHPTVVHFPLTLLPVALISDALGKLTGNKALMNAGRTLMPVGAASAAVAGTAGLLAQGSVNITGEAKELLVRHRTINMSLIGAVTAMALMRSKNEEPSTGYLMAGFGGLALLAYTAYLGGKMVYDHGVGVRPAGGLRGGEAPEIHADNLGEVGRESAARITQAAKETVSDLRHGNVLHAGS